MIHQYKTCHVCTQKANYQYDDGRLICAGCKKTAVLEHHQANGSKRKLIEKMDKIGFSNIPLDIPIFLIDKVTMTHKSNRYHTKGLTLTQKTFNPTKKITLMAHNIYILYGLPEVDFEGVLAHELLHVWQHEQGFKLSHLHTEGFCNIASYWVYKQSKNSLGDFLAKNLLESQDPIYGNGFRLMLERWKKMGWVNFLEEMVKNKQGYEESLWKKIFR